MKSVILAAGFSLALAAPALAQFNQGNYQAWQAQGASPAESNWRAFSGPPPQDNYGSPGPGNLPYTGVPTVNPYERVPGSSSDYSPYEPQR